MGSVPRQQLRNLGLVIDISGNFNNSIISLTENQFVGTRLFYKYSYEDPTVPPNHCEHILDGP